MRTSIIRICISCLLISSIVYGQSPNTPIDLDNLNVKYLEHLVKNEIDDVRLGLGIPKLLNDSILFLAAQDHANYLNEHQLFSHYQRKNPQKETPQLRAEYYGAKNYQVGENIVQISLHSNLEYQNGTLPTYTYGEVARALRLLWVDSPPHFANISTVNYDITGLALVYNQSRNELRCVQMFAAINNLYLYKDDIEMFPYAEEIPKELRQSYLPEYGKRHKIHAYGIKESKKNKICSKKRTSVFNVKSCAIGFNNDSLYLKIRKRDLSKIKSYFQHRKDGLSIEIVLFKYNYSCDIKDNYIVATRRNGRCEFDGYITPPLFKKAILDSIAKSELFLKTHKIRLDRDEFLTINMGQFPSLAKGEKFNANLIVYTKKRVCKIIEGISICGDVLNNNLPQIPIRKDFPSKEYKPGIISKTVRFKVKFEQNGLTFDKSIVDQKIAELKSSKMEVKNAAIEAYASVEGTSEINSQLFKKRAALILNYFEEHQDDSINFNLVMTENWKMFFNQIENTEYAFLKDLDTAEVRKFINEPSNVVLLEKYLKEERYVYVQLYLRPIITPEMKVDYALEEFDLILQKGNGNWKKSKVNRLLEIQNFLFNEVINEHLAYADLQIPDLVQPDLHYNRLLFDYMYAPTEKNQVDFSNELKKLVDIKSFKPVGLKTQYYLSVFNAGVYMKFNEEQSQLKSVISYLKKESFGRDTINAFYRRMQHNYVNEYYRGSGGKYSTVKKAKLYLYDYYMKELESYEDAFKFRIANYFILMKEPQWAMPIVEQLAQKADYVHKHYQQYVRLYYYLRAFDSKFEDYELVIIDSTSKLTNTEWCEMFIGGCNVSLPVFDNQTIKNLYCDKCR